MKGSTRERNRDLLKRTVSMATVAILCGSVLTARASAQAAGVTPGGPVAISGYTISEWVGPSTAYSHPDSVVDDGTYVWVGYQNVTAKDGSDNKTSTVVQYSETGTVVKTFTVPGHNDGLRIDPTTHLVWASSNEDGNPALVTINPATGAVTPYTFPSPTPHGGGYDDMAFANGGAYIAASNPTLNSSGVNTSTALYKIVLSGGQALLAPVLPGNGTALDTTTNAQVTLNEVDPDSMRVDPQGDVVLDNQAGSELVFVHNISTAQQTVTRVPVGTQIDDFVWATSAGGRLLIVDGSANTIYQMTGAFVPNTVFVEAPSDSGVAGFVGTLDLTTGTITPIAVGFGSPTGLEFGPSVTYAGIPLSATLAPSGPPRTRAVARF